MFQKRIFSMLVLLLAICSLQASADPGNYDCPGRGMMGGGYGAGMMGPGMMGGGYGPGMMGPGMMGPGGMGGGYGSGMMGPGMMGPGGMGPGMMGQGYGMGPMSMLELSKEQRQKISGIHSGLRKKNWERMGKMMDLMDRMQELSLADTPDPKAMGKVYGEMNDLRRQMMEEGVKAHNAVQAVLSKEQREQLQQMWRGGQGGPGGQRGYGGHMGMMGR